MRLRWIEVNRAELALRAVLTLPNEPADDVCAVLGKAGCPCLRKPYREVPRLALPFAIKRQSAVTRVMGSFVPALPFLLPFETQKCPPAP